MPPQPETEMFRDSIAEDHSNIKDSSGLPPSVPLEIPVEEEPAGVDQYFGFQTNAMRYFVELLAEEGTQRGLIGPKEPARIWTRHILNCAVLSEFLPADSQVADVGSGAGLPGLVLAIARPDLELTLIESMEKRCQWLEWVSAELDLDNVRVLHTRAESLHRRKHFPFLTARAVGNLATLLQWTAPLVSSSGTFLFLKGQSVETEINQARERNVFRRLQVRMPEVIQTKTPVTEEFTRVLRLIKYS